MTLSRGWAVPPGRSSSAVIIKNAKQDDEGTVNPVGGNVSWVISRGVSQSGNFLRALIHSGFTEDESKRKVYDGAWPIVAPRRSPLNTRFATPDAEPASHCRFRRTRWGDGGT